MMVVIGELFHTGQIVPVSGVYKNVANSNPDCTPTPGELEVPLSKGEHFPPDKHCEGSVTWQLKEEA